MNDPLYEEAVSIVVKTQRANSNTLQRTMRIGYNRAARMIEAMEKDGIVSPMRNDGHREVLRQAQEGGEA